MFKHSKTTCGEINGELFSKVLDFCFFDSSASKEYRITFESRKNLPLVGFIPVEFKFAHIYTEPIKKKLQHH